jgi:short subunit fatty acids transporter
MLRKLSNFFTKLIGQFLPDPFILAILISFIVLLAGLANNHSPSELVFFFLEKDFSVLIHLQCKWFLSL